MIEHGLKPMHKYKSTLTSAQKTAWIDALLSGEYAQGVGVLRRSFEDGSLLHCCLGVLGVTLGIEVIVEEFCSMDAFIIHSKSSIPLYYGLPSDVLDIYLQSALQHMNDKLQLTFEEIAKLVNEHVPVTDG